MTTTYTKNRNYPKPDFDSAAWHNQFDQAMDMIDADVSTFYAAPAFIVNAWANSHSYIVNDKVVDVNKNQLFICNVNHTSAAGGLFGDDRIAHPTYWTSFGIPFVPRGQWAQSVVYNTLDHVYDTVTGIVAICMMQHTSTNTGNIRTDASKWTYVVDNGTILTNITNSQNAAAASASQAATSATNAQNSATAAQGSATAAGTSATNAQSYATNASTSASSANTAATNASASATTASNAASSASTSASNASTSATDAANSAAQAAASASAASIAVGDTPPASPSQGKLWFDSVGAQLYVSYNDGNSSQWVVAVNNSPAIPVAAAALPLSNGIAAVGTSVKWAREDHVHPSGAIGVIDGSNAATGQIGEYIQTVGSSTGMTSATPVNVNNGAITLTPGDWDVWGSALIGPAGAGASEMRVGIATTSGVLPSEHTVLSFTSAVLASNWLTTPVYRFSVSASTNVFLVVQATFPSGTCSVPAGGSYTKARRRR